MPHRCAPGSLSGRWAAGGLRWRRASLWGLGGGLLAGRDAGATQRLSGREDKPSDASFEPVPEAERNSLCRDGLLTSSERSRSFPWATGALCPQKSHEGLRRHRPIGLHVVLQLLLGKPAKQWRSCVPQLPESVRGVSRGGGPYLVSPLALTPPLPSLLGTT